MAVRASCIDKGAPVLEADGIAVIPGGVEHKGRCREDTEVVDIFLLSRKGFWPAAGRPSYTRKLRAKPKFDII
jgi:hypothetical protein